MIQMHKMIGTVELFQGMAKTVIIESTVRSQITTIKQNNIETYKLGFINDPKRTNVAITRAKCAFILVCNADVLAEDQHWRQYIEYCIENNAYTGVPYKSINDKQKQKESTRVHR